MNETELKEIEERASKATPGPWEWAEERINKNYYKLGRDGKTRRAVYAGSLRQQFVFLLKRVFVPDERTSEPMARVYNDEPETGQIMKLAWYQVKGDTVWNVGPGKDNAAFIAHAREDVPALVAEVRRLRQLIKGIEWAADVDEGWTRGCLFCPAEIDQKHAENCEAFTPEGEVK